MNPTMTYKNPPIKFDELLDKTQVFVIDATQLNTFLIEKKVLKIIENQDLFFAAIIKAFPLVQNNLTFEVKNTSNPFSITTLGTILSESLYKNVETIRNFFFKALNNKEDLKLYFYTEKGRSYVNDQPGNFKKNHNPAFNYLRHSLPGLASFLYTDCMITEETLFNKETLISQKVTVYHISWKFLKLKELPPLNNLVNHFYEDYLVGKGCDCIIYSKKKTAIKIQSTILRHCASLPFKAMLKDTFQEAESNIINLNNFSENTIRAYLDFLYLGGNEFIEKICSLENAEIDLVEYFEFAHVFLDNAFMDCCTNLFHRLSDKNSIELIESISETYQNEHLSHLLIQLKYENSEEYEKIAS